MLCAGAGTTQEPTRHWCPHVSVERLAAWRSLTTGEDKAMGPALRSVTLKQVDDGYWEQCRSVFPR